MWLSRWLYWEPFILVSPTSLRLKAILSAFLSMVLHLASQVKERGKLKSPVSSIVTRLSRLKGSSFLVVRFPTGILSSTYS